MRYRSSTFAAVPADGCALFLAGGIDDDLAAHGANELVATACAQYLIWFLWHFTADAVPPALLSLLCAHAHLYGSRADIGAGAQCGHTALCICKQCNRYSHLQYGRMLQRLLESDSATTVFVEQRAFETLSGAAQEHLQAGSTCVRGAMPVRLVTTLLAGKFDRAAPHEQPDTQVTHFLHTGCVAILPSVNVGNAMAPQTLWCVCSFFCDPLSRRVTCPNALTPF